MGETTGIEWTDATWTPVRALLGRLAQYPSAVLPADRIGWHCEHVSEGCRNCYAETMNKRLGTGLDYKPGNLSPRGTVEMFLDEKLLLAPLKWRKPKRIFVCSMTDLFADFVPDAFIDRMFAVMALCPQHSFQVLTKRPERMRDYINASCGRIADAVMLLRKDPIVVKLGFGPSAVCPIPWVTPGAEWWPLPNVWLGVSVEDQAAADARIPLLLDTPAAVRFLSCEPLLGPVDLQRNLGGTLWIGGQRGCAGSRERAGAVHHGTGAPDCPRELHHHHDDRCNPGLDWVIAGGESGPGARPMHPDWARGLRDQCAAAGVPFLFKQWGEWFPITAAEGLALARGLVLTSKDDGQKFSKLGKKRAGRLLDGVQHDGMPA